MILEHGGEGIDFCATGFGRVAEVEGDGASGIEKLEECCIARTCQPATRAIRKHCSVAVVNFSPKGACFGVFSHSKGFGASRSSSQRHSPRFPQGSHKVPKVPARFLQGSQGSHNFVPQGSPKVLTALLQRSHKVPTVLRFPQLCPTRFPPGSHKVPKVPARFPKFPRFPQLCPTRFPQGSHGFAPRFLRGSHNFVPQGSHNFVPQGSHNFAPQGSPKVRKVPTALLQGSHKVPTRFPQL